MSDPRGTSPAPPVAPAAGTGAPASDPPHDPNSDAVTQLREALAQVVRSIGLLEPVRPEWQDPYDRLRAVRDQLEEAFTTQQTERLAAAKFDIEGDVDRLKGVIDNLTQATQRAAKTQQVLTYLTMAVDIAAQIVVKVLPFL